MHKQLARISLRTSLLYWIIASLWILGSDQVLMALTSDIKFIHQIQIYKGWAFVTITAIGLFFMLRLQLIRWGAENEERKQAEEELRRERSQLKAVFESIQDGLIVTDMQGNFLLVNEAEARINGFPSADDMKQNLQFYLDRYQTFHLNGAALPFAEWPLNRILRGESISNLALRVKRLDIEREWVFSFSGNPVYDAQGQQILAVVSNRDITESERADAELHDSEARFRALFEQSATGNIIFDLETYVVIGCNQTTSALLEYSTEELTGVPLTKFDAKYSPEEITQLRDKIKRGELIQVETIFKTKTGALRNLFVVSRTIRIKGEEFGYASLLDVTKQRQAESQLQQERLRLENIANVSPSVIYSFRRSVDGISTFPYASPSITKIFETDPSVLAQDTSHLFSLIHPDDISRIHDSITESAQTLSPWRQTWRVLNPTLGTRWIEAHSVPQREPDGSTIWHGVMTDVTERKQQEIALAEQERLISAINNAAPSIIALWDAQSGTFQYVNQSFQHILGYSPTEMMTKSHDEILQLYHPDDLPEVLAYQRSMLKIGDGVVKEHEHRFLHKNGQWRIVQTRDTIFARDEQGRATKFLTVAIDITEHKAAEVKLRLSYEQLRELTQKLQTVREEERRHLARELHDEIGQLMTGLKYLLEIIGLATEANNLKPVTEAQDLANSVLLKVRRLSLDLRPGVLDDLGLLPALLWHFNRYRGQTDIAVQLTHIGIEGKRFDKEVETAAYRIVQEALTNIARHANCKEAAVRLWADTQQIHIHIEDQGKGFKAVVLTESKDSSGLAGMRERAAILGGTLVVESEPNCGTSIFATIPLR